MNLLRITVIALSTFLAAVSTPDTIAQCVVTTQQQLLDALACVANPNCSTCNTCPSGCPEIIIPATHQDNQLAIPITQTIAINADHNNLTFTIQGTLRWEGDTSDGAPEECD